MRVIRSASWILGVTLSAATLPSACSIEDRTGYVFTAGGASNAGRQSAGAGANTRGGRSGLGAAGADAGEAGHETGASGAGSGGRSSGGSGNLSGASSGEAGSSTPPAAGSGGDPGAIEPRTCAESLLLGVASPLGSSSTRDGTNHHTGSCGAGTSNDVAFDWVVPATDYYSVNTTGSSFDTVLYARADCDGKELACNNNTGSSPQSEILSRFEKGQQVILVVDGNSGAQGDVVINAERISCPEYELSGQPLPANLSTKGGTNTHKGQCGGENQLEQAYHWTAPQSGIYQITASSTEFVPILYVERGPRCGGELLGCSAAVGKTATSYPAQVTRYFQAGQVVNLIVDGGAGFFTLDAKRLDPGTTCGTAALPSGQITLKRGTAVGHVSQSCSFGGSIDMFGGGPFPYSTAIYKLESDLMGIAACTYEVKATGPISVSLVKGQCSGSEVRCVASTQSGSEHTASFSLGVADDGVYTLVIQNNSLGDIQFSVAAFCVA